MGITQDIRKPVTAELERYEHYLKQTLHSEHELTHIMLDYIFSNRGKGIRPLMVMLSASMLNAEKELPEETMVAAMLVEMMHTASLVHDDVIDEAHIRRGKPSVKAMWRSHMAVLIGDYILARSFTAGLNTKAYDIVSFIAGAMTALCEGELLQSEQSDKLQMTREIYNEIIYKKTANLIGTCSGSGAMSVKASTEDTARMRNFGDSLGMAFQIKDDILDYSASEKTGKPACGDLRERKITLPLLMVIDKSPQEKRRRIIGLLSDVRNSPENADKLYEIVMSENGLELASAQMHVYLDKCRSILAHYPRSPYRHSLELMCEYVLTREK